MPSVFMVEPPVLEFFGAATALFLSILILSAVARQETRKPFQKRALLLSIVLLIGAIVSNTVITIYLRMSSGPAFFTPENALVVSKKMQGTFDLLFAITMGTFVLATAKPEIDSRKAWLNHMRQQFPNPFLFYIFVQVIAIAALWVSTP